MDLRHIILIACCVVSIASDESVNNYVRATLENLRGEMRTGIPSLKIPKLEPLSVPRINEHVKEGAADVNILIDSLKIEGLSKFVTTNVDANLQNLRLSIGLTVPQVAGNAKYDLNGKIFNLIPLYGNGDAHVNLVDVSIDATAALAMTGDGHLKANDFKLNVKVGTIFVNLENILGGGSLGQVVNGIVNMIGTKIFDHFRPDLMKILNKAIYGELNKALSKVKLSDIQGGLVPSAYVLDNRYYDSGNANEFLDKLLTNARPQIAAVADPVKLPDAKKSFSKKIIFVQVHGEAKVYDGWLAGLKTLHRTGDAELSNAPDGQAILVSAHLGVNNLKGHYRAYAKFMNLGPHAEASISVSSVSVRASIKQGFTGNAHPELLSFKIEGLGGVKVHFSGLGPLDWIINPLANLVVKLVKGEIVKAIEAPVRNVIRNELGKIKIPFGG